MNSMSPHRLGLFVFVAAAALFLLDAFEFAESKLTDLRFEAWQGEAPQTLVIIAIDPKSLAEVGVWPWPRRHHATVLDNLVAAGATRVAFDVDFSSPSNPEDDRALETSLANAGRKTILPVFKQFVKANDGRRIIHNTAPLERFRRHVALASINVRPDSDGNVRRMNRRDIWNGYLMPTMATALAESPIESYDSGIYYVDYGIPPGDLPRISFVDILKGEFDPAKVAGKRVIIGATAVELGDQLAVPVHRALPGVMVQSLAHASLTTDRALVRLPLVATILLALALSLLLMPFYCAWRWPRGLALAGGAVGVLGIASTVVQAAFPLVIDVAPLMFIAITGYGVALTVSLDKAALSLFRGNVQLRRLEALGKVVLEAGGHAVVIVDHRGRIQVFNPAAEMMFGYTADEVEGQTFERLFAGDDGGYRGDLLNPILTEQMLGASREFETVRKDGTHFYVEAIVKRINEQPSDHRLERRTVARSTHICTLVDITKRKQVELNEHLLRLQAQSADKAKSTFLANMSHELRTPLNSIIGFSQIMQSEKTSNLTDREKEYVTDILGSGHHLLNLINDILDLSKIEAEKLELQISPVDGPGLVEAAVKFVEMSAATGRVSLHADVSSAAPEAWVDERAMKQVLINLLSNAVKFTPPGGEVRIVADLSEEGDFRITVQDTGVGIRNADMEKVFAPFGQITHGLHGKVEGTGLGLPLSRRLVELHRGTLTLESQFGEGTCVTVTLPMPHDPDAQMETIH